jgi:hypothetical protein
MKNSIVRGALLFVAGAACATVVIAGINPKVKAEPLTVKMFEQRVQLSLAQVSDFGRYVGAVKDGRVFMTELPVDACVTPPRPTVVSPGVNPVWLQAGMDAMGAMNVGYNQGQGDLVVLDGKCHPVH